MQPCSVGASGFPSVSGPGLRDAPQASKSFSAGYNLGKPAVPFLFTSTLHDIKDFLKVLVAVGHQGSVVNVAYDLDDVPLMMRSFM
ncbi:hypothetical protein ElyMa_006246000 [Elysia marginata]|uniref:Uncharacterized protein n=1 Tax=Elysia marginata TaxID=1093978 RepID=A0AAV4H947_9GAST|nr:hypothetical protein ElyMa_006246000 [Elysia marginata]